MVTVKQLAYENANATCQTAIHPFRKKRDISGYICLCADIMLKAQPWLWPSKGTHTMPQLLAVIQQGKRDKE